jgi:DnaJ-domain-containing protein 1
MKSQFHVDCGPGSTTHESHEAIPAIEANRQGNTWEFVSGLQRLLGDDAEPDPLFFVESWTVGVPVAVENWQKRRQVQKGHERQHRVFSECGSLGVQSIARQSELGASLALLSGADAKTARYNVGWSQHSFEKSPSQFKASQEWKPFAEVADGGRAAIHPMSKLRAFELLEVNPASTRRQIKAAYRRMVNQIHPDRLEHRTEGVRRLANDQMAEINEAYHLLCNGLL